jgi:hypothetical protein
MEGIPFKGEDTKAIIVCSAPEYNKQKEVQQGLLQNILTQNGQTIFSIESLCSSGNCGLHALYAIVKATLYNIVVAVGFQKCLI